MGVFKLADFHKLMDDVRRFTSILEEVAAKAANPKEKELLGLAIDSIKRGTAEATVAVPAAAEAIETEARRIIAEGETIQQELKKEMAKASAQYEAAVKEEAAQAAQAPTLEQMYGPVQPVDGAALRADLFQALNLQPPKVAAATDGRRDAPGDIWDWLKRN